jgi:DnaJ-class molecular chaperone
MEHKITIRYLSNLEDQADGFNSNGDIINIYEHRCFRCGGTGQTAYIGLVFDYIECQECGGYGKLWKAFPEQIESGDKNAKSNQVQVKARKSTIDR